MFDIEKTIDENLAVFRAACEGIDAECAAILFENIAILQAGGSDRAARSRFNERVRLALERAAKEGAPL